MRNNLDSILLLTTSTLGRLNSADQSIAGIARDLTYVVRGARNAAVAAAGLFALQKAFLTVIQAGERMDQTLIKSQIYLGSFGNALMAYKKYQDGIVEGKLLGQASEYLEAARMLGSKGLTMTDSIVKMMNNMSAASGNSINQVSSDIASAIAGNQSALVAYGITARTMHRYTRLYEGDTVMMRSAVMNILAANKNLDGAVENLPLTWQRITNRLKAMKDKFIEAIVGNAKDPNSLGSIVKRTVWSALDYLHKNAATFKAIAGTISAYLKFTFQIIARFVKFVFDATLGASSMLSNYLDNWKENTAAIIAYLALTAEQIRRFYNEHADLIKTLIKLYIGYKIAMAAANVGLNFATMGKGIASLLKSVKNTDIGTAISNAIAGGLSGMSYVRLSQSLNSSYIGMLRWARGTGTGMANSLLVGLTDILAGAFGTIGSFLLGPLVILGTESEAIRSMFGGWFDTLRDISGVLGLVMLFINPLAGAILLIGYYWQQIKETIFNTWNFIKSIFNLFRALGGAIDRFLNKTAIVKDIWGGIKSIFETLWDFIKGIPWFIEQMWKVFNTSFGGIIKMISKLANWLDTTNQDPNTGKIYTSAGAYTKQGGNQVEISSQLNSRSLTVDSTLTNDPEARNKFFSNTNARDAINSIFPSGTDINRLESYVNSGATSEQIKKYESIIDKLIAKDSANKEFYVEFKIPEGLNPGQTAEYMIKSLEELAEKTGSNPSTAYNY